MAEGDTHQRYGSTDKTSDRRKKSNHAHAITAAAAAGCARYGWSQAQFTHALLDTPSAAGRHARNMLHRRGRDKALEYLERVWERAEELVGTTAALVSRQDWVVDLVALRDHIASTCWRGLAASTEMRVLMAHWKAAKRCGGREHTLSYREAAELAGCTTYTCYRATKRLVTNGWLRKVNSGSATEGSCWVLLETPRGAESTGEMDGEVISRLMGLDAFAHRGLGASSLKILAALSACDRQTVQDLRQSASISQATAYRHLKALADHGLAEKVGEVWQLSPTARDALTGEWEGWDEVAAQEGTYGTLWRRQRLHADQRAIWLSRTYPRLRDRRMPDVIPIRGDEPEPDWIKDGLVVDPRSGEIIPNLVVATDGKIIFIPDDFPASA